MDELSRRERGRLWLRMGLRLALLILCLWALIALGPTLWSLFAPFLLAVPMAWLLSPAVKWLHKKLGLPRRLLTVVLLILVFGALAGLAWGLTAGALGEMVSLAGDWAGLVSSLRTGADGLGATFSRAMDLLPPSAQDLAGDLETRLFTWLGTAIPRLLSKALDIAADMVRALPSFAVATVVFIMASYFLTADSVRLRNALAGRLPEGVRFFLSLVKRAASAGFGGYLRSELILSAGVFGILLVGFLLVRQPYALLLAFFLAVLDFIPIIGSGTVMVPWALVDLLTGEVRHAVGLLAVWGLVALFRRLAEPKILGDQTGLPPILSLVAIYAGMRVGGVMGMILAPILCLVVLNVCRSGVLDNARRDMGLAWDDLSAILKGGAGEKP